MKKSSNKGFTLVELIIVIAILAIIMLIAIPNFSGIQQRMQVRADKSTAAQIGKAVRVWFTDYTTDSGMLGAKKSIDDITADATHKIAPVGKTVNSKTFDSIASIAVNAATGTEVVPNNYNTLVAIDEYISRGQEPTSLRTSNVQDTKQFYGVFLTAGATDTAAKIAVAIDSETASLDPVKINRDATSNKIIADYDGTKPAVAYIEP